MVLRQASEVSRTRRTGLILAGIASALWVVVVVAFFSTGPEDGVNLGAALLAMVAVPLSLASSVVLLVSLRGERRSGRGVARAVPRPRVAAAVLSVVAMALLCIVFVIGPTDSLPADTMVALLLSGIGAFLTAFALYLLPVDDA
jgi:ABC-type Na+ efflux pump permease subunit